MLSRVVGVEERCRAETARPIPGGSGIGKGGDMPYGLPCRFLPDWVPFIPFLRIFS